MANWLTVLNKKIIVLNDFFLNSDPYRFIGSFSVAVWNLMHIGEQFLFRVVGISKARSVELVGNFDVELWLDTENVKNECIGTTDYAKIMDRL